MEEFVSIVEVNKSTSIVREGADNLAHMRYHLHYARFVMPQGDDRGFSCTVNTKKVLVLIRVRLREVMKLYEVRSGQRMTYERLSEEAGLSVATLQSLGSRDGYNATLNTVEKICRVLGCGLEELLELSGD